MKERLRTYMNRVLQVPAISAVAFSMDYIIVLLSRDDSIWLWEAIAVPICIAL